MDTAKIYYDSEGNERTIHQMIKLEPEWAANRIQEGEKALNKARVAIYCQDCQEMFFVCRNEPTAIIESRKEIEGYTDQGHELRLVSMETVRKDFNGCICTKAVKNRRMLLVK